MSAMLSGSEIGSGERRRDRDKERAELEKKESGEREIVDCIGDVVCLFYIDINQMTPSG